MKHVVDVRTPAAWRSFAPAIRRAARKALEHERAQPGRVTILLVGQPKMAEFHQRFSGLAGPTDVLSFSDGAADEDARRRYFGDILICVPVAKRQARRAGQPPMREIARLAVHGVLHLLGHDHDRPGPQARMWARQEKILDSAFPPGSRARASG
ncbi:MAG TPA: rRNA maturation RNase YbeY [Anaerolineales bacterium]|nr:rRNA maturation RNase YbeY [Anaerolineales bacterium]